MATTEAKAANLLLDRGIRFTIPDAPFLDKLLRKNKIHIKPLRAGTIMEIAILIIERGLDDRTLTNLQLQTKIDDIAEIVATAVLNDNKQIELEREGLTKKLLWKVPAHVLIKIYRYIESLNELEAFTIITNYFNHQATMLMRKRTGQRRKGSQKVT